MNWRTDEALRGRYYNAHGQPVDGGGAVIPHKISAVTYLEAAGVLSEFNKRVPDEHWDEEVTDEDLFAVIRCVCGEKPTIHLGGVHVCEGGCGRAFLYEGAPGRTGRRAVFVARFPAGESSDARS